MKIICQKQVLCEAVTNVGRAVATKSSLPALEGILIKTKETTVTLSGYDLEMGIITEIPAKIEEAGSLILPARLFTDLVRHMSDDTITIQSDKKLLTTIESGTSQFTILGIPADEFPNLPEIEGEEAISLPQSVLKSMIGQTLFAIAQTDIKPVHTGSLFDLSDKLLTIVSVDGFRLALRREPVKTSEERKFVVPGKTLSELLKLLKDDKDEQVEQVEITLSGKHIIFALSGYYVISRTLEGDFLDYTAAINQQTNTSVTVNKRMFQESLERVSLLISDRLKSPLRCRFEGQEAVITCTSPIGKANDSFLCQTTGNPLEIGFNNKYLLDAVKACDCDEIKMELSGALAPMRILPPDGDSFLFLVLPVRLKSDEN